MDASGIWELARRVEAAGQELAAVPAVVPPGPQVWCSRAARLFAARLAEAQHRVDRARLQLDQSALALRAHARAVEELGALPGPGLPW